MALFQPCDRNYLSWSWSDQLDHEHVDPVGQKLLVGDSLLSNGHVKYSSPYRTSNTIPGVLVLDGSTYGRYGSRMLYKCIPHDSQLPTFVVPYAFKTVEFSKHKFNRYVLFRFAEWEDKHPQGILTETIGTVDDLTAFYQYQIHARGLHHSVQPLAKHVKKALPVTIDETAMKDRRTWDVFAIDPTDCSDFDDALGFRQLEDGRSLMSVYIANVPVWLEALSAWDHLGEQAATIYFPDGKRSMLPSILSEKLCSLRAGEDKYVWAMDVELEDTTVREVRFTPCIVRIRRNYVYDEDDLKHDPMYRHLFETVREIRTDYPYVDSVRDSHDVVEFLMVMMNHEASKLLYAAGRGIFRDVRVTSTAPLEHELLRIWRHTKGSYVVAGEHGGHQMMGLDTYVQITSPIRRMFDLVNMVELAEVCGFMAGRSEAREAFVAQTVTSLDRLNDTMKQIRAVQNDCVLLDYCQNRSSEEPLTAYTLDEEGALYIPELRTVVRFEGTDQPPYTEVMVRLHVFTDEATLWRKVRIQLV